MLRCMFFSSVGIKRWWKSLVKTSVRCNCHLVISVSAYAGWNALHAQRIENQCRGETCSYFQNTFLTVLPNAEWKHREKANTFWYFHVPLTVNVHGRDFIITVKRLLSLWYNFPVVRSKTNSLFPRQHTDKLHLIWIKWAGFYIYLQFW